MKANLKPFYFFIFLLLLTGMIMRDAIAQPPPDRNHRRERLETVIIGKFATELELTPQQAERFFPLFRQFSDASQELQRRQHDARIELDNFSAQESAPPEEVKRLLDLREQNQQEAIRLRRQFLDDVSGFLTPQQISRCSVLLEELPAKIRDMIHEERRRQRTSDKPRAKSR